LTYLHQLKDTRMCSWRQFRRPKSSSPLRFSRVSTSICWCENEPVNTKYWASGIILAMRFIVNLFSTPTEVNITSHLKAKFQESS
jgi:hypothetical protein